MNSIFESDIERFVIELLQSQGFGHSSSKLRKGKKELRGA